MNDLVSIQINELFAGNHETQLQLRNRIFEIEQAILKLPQVEFPTRHSFCKGLYIREIDVPANHILTGYIHKDECAVIVSKGSILVATEKGIKRVDAPYTYISTPGAKRLGVTLTDVTWTNVHPNPDNITDVDKLEEILYTNDPDWYNQKEGD